MSRARPLLLVLALLATPATAGEGHYEQVRVALDEMRGLMDSLDETIRKRDKRDRGPDPQCLDDQRQRMNDLWDLAQRARTELVDALAVGDQRVVALMHRDVLIYRSKAVAVADGAHHCPIVRDRRDRKND